MEGGQASPHGSRYQHYRGNHYPTEWGEYQFTCEGIWLDLSGGNSYAGVDGGVKNGGLWRPSRANPTPSSNALLPLRQNPLPLQFLKMGFH